MLASARVDSPIGPVTLVASDAGLRAVLWETDSANWVHLDAHPHEDPSHPVLSEGIIQLVAYFAGDRCSFDIPLDLQGTAFQHSVWGLLRTIPHGETWTYGQIAERLGRPGAARAVGAANGRNPLPIVVPCHRVVGSDGSLTGYAGGLEKKAWLLAHEQGVRTPR